MEAPIFPIVFLVGPRCSGKTTVAGILASSLGLEAHDTDDILIAIDKETGKKESGRSIADIVAAEGWTAFRELESRALAAVAGQAGRLAPLQENEADDHQTRPSRSVQAPESGAERDTPGKRHVSGITTVVATGGGMVLSPANRELMRSSGVVLYLSAPVSILRQRLSQGENTALRPSLTGADPGDEIARVLAEREPLYRESAHHVLDASLPPDMVAQSIIAILSEGSENTTNRHGGTV